MQEHHGAVLEAALAGDSQRVTIADLAHRLDRPEVQVWESLEWLAANNRAAYIRHSPATVSVRRMSVAGRPR